MRHAANHESGGELIMGYVAVRGGIQAIENSEQLAEYVRLMGQSTPLGVNQIQDQMRLLVDRVMGEGGLYSPLHAALAIKQAEGDTLEAAFYVRAYRSTLSRLCDSLPLDMNDMHFRRRISSAFKDVPGGQILGYTPDYRQRMLDFSLLREDEESRRDFLSDYEEKEKTTENPPLAACEKVVSILRKQGLVRPVAPRNEEDLFDITQESV